MNTLISMLFVNWKTTLLGSLAATATALSAFFSKQSAGIWPYIGSAILFLWGLVSKDHNVSGTATVQAATATATPPATPPAPPPAA